LLCKPTIAEVASVGLKNSNRRAHLAAAGVVRAPVDVPHHASHLVGWLPAPAASAAGVPLAALSHPASRLTPGAADG